MEEFLNSLDTLVCKFAKFIIANETKENSIELAWNKFKKDNVQVVSSQLKKSKKNQEKPIDDFEYIFSLDETKKKLEEIIQNEQIDMLSISDLIEQLGDYNFAFTKKDSKDYMIQTLGLCKIYDQDEEWLHEFCRQNNLEIAPNSEKSELMFIVINNFQTANKMAQTKQKNPLELLTNKELQKKLSDAGISWKKDHKKADLINLLNSNSDEIINQAEPISKSKSRKNINTDDYEIEPTTSHSKISNIIKSKVESLKESKSPVSKSSKPSKKSNDLNYESESSTSSKTSKSSKSKVTKSLKKSICESEIDSEYEKPKTRSRTSVTSKSNKVHDSDDEELPKSKNSKKNNEILSEEETKKMPKMSITKSCAIKTSKKNEPETIIAKETFPEDLEKKTVPELRLICEKYNIPKGGVKTDLIKRIKSQLLIEDRPKIQFKKNGFGNYEHPSSRLVVSNITKIVCGTQQDDGTILPLTQKDINFCTDNNLQFDINSVKSNNVEDAEDINESEEESEIDENAE